MKKICFYIILFSFKLFFTSGTYGQTKHYRSIRSGNWNDAGIWETADDISFTVNLSEAGSPPDNNDGLIIIMTGTVVTIHSTVHANEVEVQEGATLILSPGNNLYLWNETGIDLLVNGTFEDKTANANGLKFEGGATWALGENGTFVKYNTSSSAVLRDNYHQGMENIPPTAHWIIRREASNQTPRFTTINTYYPNLTFENLVEDHWNPGSISNRFTGSSTNVVIKGSLNIGGNGSGTVTIYNENFNANPMEIKGDLIIKEGSIFTNKGNENGTGIEVYGNIINNGTLDFSGGTGTLTINNTTGVIGGAAGTISVQNLVVNADNLLTIENLLLIENELSITKGKIIVPENNIQLSETAILSGENDENYIIGKIETSRNLNYTTNTFGNIGIEINANNEDLGRVTVKRETGIAYLLGNTESIKRRWEISTEKLPENKVWVRLQWNSKDEEGFQPENFQLYKFIPDSEYWIPADKETSFGEHHIMFETTFGSDQQNEIILTSLSTGYANYTIGEKSEPLPVFWLKVDAELKDNLAVISWVTAWEKNNKGFTIQKSYDLQKWKDIGFVKGSGTTYTTSDYQFADQNFENKAYYRIRQTDYNGAYSLSKTVFLIGNNTDILSPKFTLFPNPASYHLHIQGHTEKAVENLNLSFYSQHGKLFLHTSGSIEKVVTELNKVIEKVKSGGYILKIESQGDMEIHKIKVVK